MKKLICITGLDGTGKSTLVKALATQLPQAVVVSIWDLFGDPTLPVHPFRSKEEIDQYLCALPVNARVLFLAHAFSGALEKAMRGPHSLLILDGYWYKYFAPELALGADFALVQALVAAYPRPALTVELVLPPSIAAERKGRLSRYECGCAPVAEQAAFADFQQQAAAQWDHFREDNWLQISSLLSPVVVLAQVLEVIAGQL